MISWTIAVVEAVVFIIITLLYSYLGPVHDGKMCARSYPPAIRERYYLDHERPAEPSRRRDVAERVFAIVLVSGVTAACAVVAGAEGFVEGFAFGFIVFLALIVYALAFGCLVFPRAKWVRLPGTEDMDAEYSDISSRPRRFAYPGLVNAAAVGLVTGAILFLVG